MVYNRLFFSLLLRVILLIATIGFFSSIFLRPELFFTQIILGAIITFQVFEITHLINKTNTELSRFLAGIRDGDYQLNYNKNAPNRSFKALYNSFGELVETLKYLETERMAQFHFLNELINQIQFGLLVFNEDDDIELMNNQAMELTALPKITKWKKIRNPNIQFLETILSLEPAQNQLIETHLNGESRYFSVSINEVKILSKSLKVVSFQDIRGEIRKKEVEAWHKLIRILTHETMNSVTPIISLAETMKLILEDDEGNIKQSNNLTEENILDVTESLETLIGRGQGMLKFVTEYRKLTRIPKPELEETSITGFIDSILRLMQDTDTKNGVKFKKEIAPFSIPLDPVLIQQVLINLIKNAIESLATTPNPEIVIVCKEGPEKQLISVLDNGPGVSKDKLEKIFIPFYSTKKEGSGIGLSVSRQIMNLHEGHLELTSIPGKITNFTLVFPKKNGKRNN